MGKGLPANGSSSPGKTCAEGDEDNMVAASKLVCAVSFIQSDGTGCGRGIPVLVKVHKDAFFGNFDSLGDGLDNP